MPHGDVSYGAMGSGDACWVTVFGFPGRAASLVRQQLETQCGPIVKVRHGDGNYMHVRFHSVAAAGQCLALNGRQLVGKLLIGCVPRTSGLAGDNDMRDDASGDIGGSPGQGPPIAGGSRARMILSLGTSSFDDNYGPDGGPSIGPRAAMFAPPAARD